MLDDSKLDPPRRKVQLDGLKEACNRVPPRAIPERRAAGACCLCCVARSPASQPVLRESYAILGIARYTGRALGKRHTSARAKQSPLIPMKQMLGGLFSVAGYDSVESMYRPICTLI